MQLSERMQAVASMVTPGSRVADIGTDHGYVPIYLMEKNIAAHAIAMDVRPGPLSRARDNIEKNGLEGKIETRLSDGLHQLKEGEADTIVVAGMGGLLMIRILQEGLELLKSVKECILQPQSDIDSVRRFLHANGFCIEEENMVIDEGKYYVIMRVIHGVDAEYNVGDDLYGKLLIENGHPVLKRFLEKEKRSAKNIMEKIAGQTGVKSRQRLEELEDSLKCIEEVLMRMENSQLHTGQIAGEVKENENR